jgi:hypothetical protein
MKNQNSLSQYQLHSAQFCRFGARKSPKLKNFLVKTKFANPEEICFENSK